jgi:hypothetical protein
LIKAMAEIQPLTSPGWLWTLTASASISAILGISGLLLMRQHWREKDQAAWTSTNANV